MGARRQHHGTGYPSLSAIESAWQPASGHLRHLRQRHLGMNHHVQKGCDGALLWGSPVLLVGILGNPSEPSDQLLETAGSPDQEIYLESPRPVGQSPGGRGVTLVIAVLRLSS